LGAVDTEDLWGRSTHLPAVQGSNEDHQRYRPARHSKTHFAASGAVGDAEAVAAIGLLCGEQITTYNNIDPDYSFESYI
jgi:hypothetical protein